MYRESRPSNRPSNRQLALRLPRPARRAALVLATVGLAVAFGGRPAAAASGFAGLGAYAEEAEPSARWCQVRDLLALDFRKCFHPRPSDVWIGAREGSATSARTVLLEGSGGTTPPPPPPGGDDPQKDRDG